MSQSTPHPTLQIRLGVGERDVQGVLEGLSCFLPVPHGWWLADLSLLQALVLHRCFRAIQVCHVLPANFSWGPWLATGGVRVLLLLLLPALHVVSPADFSHGTSHRRAKPVCARKRNRAVKVVVRARVRVRVGHWSDPAKLSLHSYLSSGNCRCWKGIPRPTPDNFSHPS